jgi:RNA polymerase sigma-70 factor (ECF subfamily)
VYSQCAPLVWRTLRSLRVHESLVPDAFQDVFIVVYRRYPEFDHRCKVSTWVYEITSRVARAHRRRHARGSALFTTQHRELPADDSPARRAECNERARVLSALLSRLADDKREVLVLAEIEGLSAPEIAQITSSSLNNVYSRLRRARIEFNALVAQHRRRTRAPFEA